MNIVLFIMNLVRNVSSLFFQPPERNILLFGSRGAGKTTLLYRLKMGEEIETTPTLGYNVEVIEWKKRQYCIYDFGDGLDHRTRPLVRCHLNADSLVFFLHDCTTEDTEDSVRVLHEYVKEMLDAGAKFLWIVLNKLELTELESRHPDKMRGIAMRAKHRFEYEMETRYSGCLVWKVMAIEGLSGKTGDRISEVFDDIAPTLRKHWQFKPVLASSSGMGCQGLIEKKRVAVSSAICHQISPAEVNLAIDSEAFWKGIQDGSLTLYTHHDRIRASYMIVLDNLDNKKGILEIPEKFHLQVESLDCNRNGRNRLVYS